jgi:hypothetical protein
MLHVIGFTPTSCQRLGTVRPSPFHPGEVADHRNEHCRRAERRDKVPSFHSITSPVLNRKESRIGRSDRVDAACQARIYQAERTENRIYTEPHCIKENMFTRACLVDTQWKSSFSQRADALTENFDYHLGW